jgi:erythritol kinase
VVNLLGLADIAELDAYAATAQPRAGGIIFLPYLSPAGERAPFLEPRAQGSFHGLTLLHKRAELARSVYEGLSFAIRECLESAAEDITEVRVCGGGARSGFWCQMIADVAGLTVLRPVESEMGARGAFLFALKATGSLESVAEGTLRYPVKMDAFYPTPKIHETYDVKFSIFQSMRKIARQQWILGEARV